MLAGKERKSLSLMDGLSLYKILEILNMAIEYSKNFILYELQKRKELKADLGRLLQLSH